MTDHTYLIEKLRGYTGPWLVPAKAAAALAALVKERDAYKRLENEAAEAVESVICLRTDFSGEPPYVGWKGIGLKVREIITERDAALARVKRLEDAPMSHKAADAFWKYWRENGETGKHGYYEATWGAIRAALAEGDKL